MYEIFPFHHSRETEGSQEYACENELVREEEATLSSFPPAVAGACPMWDRCPVTREASAVVASMRNQRESHLFMQASRGSGGGRGRTGSLEIGRRKEMRKKYALP